jgi:putative toxin-antitoxin system antitoxin component (TIGR02293 family)
MDNCLDNQDKFPYLCKNTVIMITKTKTKSVLRKYENHLDDRFWIVEEAAAGVPASAVFDLMGMTHLSKSFFAGMLNLSTKTLDRYLAGGKQLNASSGEMILKLFSLVKKGEEIFGNADEFGKWIEKPAYGLGFKVPKELMKSAAGVDLVMDELIRIEYGNLA